VNGAGTMNSPVGAVLRWGGERYETLTTRCLAARGMAVLRIGYGSLWVLFLLHEYGERDSAWGPDSPWSPALEHQYAALWGWPGPLRIWLTSVADLTHTEFDLFYLLAIAVGAAFALGWHTRVSSILFAVIVTALENRSPMLTDGGDNVMTLMSLYLAFTACGAYWSLDARRRERRRSGSDAPEPESAPEPEPEPPTWRGELSRARARMVTVVHNGAVLLIAAQICVVYGTAGLLKVQGSMWQDGSALGYVLKLDWFHPWPGLSAWLAGHALLLTLAGYVTVFVQAGFPFIVFTPRLKYPALGVLVLMHLSIAVLLGLPFFSAIMIVGDAVFLPDRAWEAFGRWVSGPAYADHMAASAPTLVFDGDCGFCTASVRWAQRWCRPAVEFVPWQLLDLEANGLTQDEVTRAVQWLPLSPKAPVRSGAGAAARTLLRSRWPWRPLGLLMLLPPTSWIAAVAYRMVAANRYRLPGGTPACAVPAAAPRQKEPEPQEPEPRDSEPREPELPQGLGDLGGGPDDAGAGAGGVELAERDHAD
jgi:predicted DCC family thiol-disulfide oxidoreductase YuxK